MGLIVSFFGTGMFATSSKTDWKVMGQCKEKKGKGQWKMASRSHFSCRVFPALANLCVRHPSNRRSFTLSGASFLTSKPWVVSSCWSNGGATPFGQCYLACSWTKIFVQKLDVWSVSTSPATEAESSLVVFRTGVISQARLATCSLDL